MQTKGCAIDPRRVKIMAKWDILMMLCMIFTAIVTPVEVTFLAEGAHVNGLWVINRFVDLCFIIDIFLTFNLMYQETPKNGGHCAKPDLEASILHLPCAVSSSALSAEIASYRRSPHRRGLE